MKKSPKQPYRLWGGRFEKGAGEQLETFSRSLQFDYRLAQADIRGTKAYAGELQRLGIFSRPEAEKISKSLDAIATEAAAAGKKYFEGAAEEDIHTFL
ncbi:MAG: argininosuccinate lyase, partial [Acidobacteria bacterium]|nr:argininosuccinate lyase [Acidobacteriota bacterium]